MEGAESTARPAHIAATLREHLRRKLKEQSFVQDERDPCLFIDVVRDICTCVHVDDMLAVAPKRCDETTVARAREGYGDALKHGDRETTGVHGTILEQNDEGVHLGPC